MSRTSSTFNVGKGTSVITVTSTAPGGAVVGGAGSPAATATSGDTVTITIDASSSAVCSISSGHVTFQSVGTCKVDFNDTGNANYDAAAQVQQSFTVGKGTSVITFTSTPPRRGGRRGQLHPHGDGTSGDPVTFSIDASANAGCSASRVPPSPSWPSGPASSTPTTPATPATRPPPRSSSPYAVLGTQSITVHLDPARRRRSEGPPTR